MTVSNGDVISVVVDFIDSAGYHFKNKFTYQADFVSDQSEATVIFALEGHLEDLYGNLAAAFTSAIDDPDIYVDIIEWVTDAWEVTANVGTGQLATTFTNASQILPFQTAACLVGRTARPRSRGRKFMPPMGEDQQQGSDWTAALKTLLALALADYIDTIVISAGNELIAGVPSNITQTFLPIVSGVTSDFVRTQRRRTPGYGE